MNIRQDKSTVRITWNEADFITGFVPMQTSSATRIIGNKGSGATYLKDFDPFRIPGMAYPGFNGADVSNVSLIDALLIDSILDIAGSFVYAIGGSKVHQVIAASGNITSGGGWPYTLTRPGVHAAHASTSFLTVNGVFGATAQYNVGSTPYMFYSYVDDTDWDVGRFDLATTFVDNYMTGTAATPLAGADLTDGRTHPHPLYVDTTSALMYIGAGRYTHAFDGNTGANGTFNSQVFIHPPNYEVVGYGETNYDLCIYLTSGRNTGRRAVSKVYFYGADRGRDPYKFVNIDDDEIGAAFNYQGTTGCFSGVRNSNRYCLRLFDGVNFVPKFYFSGSLPMTGGVEVLNNQISWNSSGVCYVWGGKDDQFPTQTYQPFTGSGTSSGLLKTFAPAFSTLSMSSGTTTSGGLQLFNSNYAASTLWHGLTAAPGFPAGKVARVKEVKTTFGNIASGGRGVQLQFKTNMDQTTTTMFFSPITTVTALTLVRVDKLDSSGAPLPKFESIKPILTWSTGSGATSAPGIKQIELICELRNV